MGGRRLRIGYWVSERKSDRLDMAEVRRRCEQRGWRLVELALLDDLERQGPLDILLHATSDLMARQREDATAAEQMAVLKRYAATHPETALVDPLSGVRKLAHRLKMYKMLQERIVFDDVQVPPFLLVRGALDYKERVKKVRLRGLVYPLLAKPLLAHQHDMTLVYSETGLRALCETPADLVLQTFIPHDGVLFKIFVLGAATRVVRRPSLRNLRSSASEQNRRFATVDVSKPGCASELNARPGALEAARGPDKAKVDRLVERFSRHTKLTLYGIDLIVEHRTGRHYVIDVNYLPGFEGVDDVPRLLLAHLERVSLDQQRRRRQDLPSTASEITESCH